MHVGLFHKLRQLSDIGSLWPCSSIQVTSARHSLPLYVVINQQCGDEKRGPGFEVLLLALFHSWHNYFCHFPREKLSATLWILSKRDCHWSVSVFPYLNYSLSPTFSHSQLLDLAFKWTHSYKHFRLSDHYENTYLLFSAIIWHLLLRTKSRIRGIQ